MCTHAHYSVWVHVYSVITTSQHNIDISIHAQCTCADIIVYLTSCNSAYGYVCMLILLYMKFQCVHSCVCMTLYMCIGYITRYSVYTIYTRVKGPTLCK